MNKDKQTGTWDGYNFGDFYAEAAKDFKNFEDDQPVVMETTYTINWTHLLVWALELSAAFGAGYWFAS